MNAACNVLELVYCLFVMSRILYFIAEHESGHERPMADQVSKDLSTKTLFYAEILMYNTHINNKTLIKVQIMHMKWCKS